MYRLAHSMSCPIQCEAFSFVAACPQYGPLVCVCERPPQIPYPKMREPCPESKKIEKLKKYEIIVIYTNRFYSFLSIKFFLLPLIRISQLIMLVQMLFQSSKCGVFPSAEATFVYLLFIHMHRFHVSFEMMNVS